MSLSLRLIPRGALAAWTVAAGLAVASHAARAEAPAEKRLPADTLALIQVKNAEQLRTVIKQTQFGRMLADPAMQPALEEVKGKLNEASDKLREKLGLSLMELLELPQGPASIAVLPGTEEKLPVAVVISADAGKNQSAMQGLMDKATKLANDSGEAKSSTETVGDLKVTVIQSTKEGEQDNPPVAWTSRGSVFHIATGVDALKTALEHQDGREDSLSGTDAYQAVQRRVGNESQVVWFLNLEQIIKRISEVASRQGNVGEGEIDAQLQVLGLNNLKAIGGSISLRTGEFDAVSRAFLYAPGEAQGVPRLFQMPMVDLSPQPWVSATIDSYQSISWDLDAFYTSLNELLDTFLPGVLGTFEEQLAGPQGDGIKFREDVFGPLGDRITIVSDFKEPDNIESQRVLVAVSLEDSAAMKKTLDKIFEMTGAEPRKRDFQGTTIYEVDLPDLPNAGGAQLKGPISLTIAKDHLFAASDASIIEQALTAKGPGLAQSPEYQAVARHFPKQSSTLNYQRPEPQARAFYELLKSGQFKEILRQAGAEGGAAAAADAADLVDPKKLPDFSVIAKYLAPSGGYWVSEPDGMSMTSFTILKTSP